ncbi:MAG TPA: hypothetical protein VKX28_26845 [Xanthobacteraceae bacterium]|nr:hypothetical protein [Xanthobacteraceae bacterium]
MSFVAVAIAGSAAAGLGGAYLTSQAAKNASNAQVQQGEAALAQQNALFQQGVGMVQPYIDRGNTAGATLSSLLTPGPNQTATLSQIPGFTFAQDWGQKAVQNIGTVNGLGGNTLTAGANFATGQAQQGFGTLAQLLLGLTQTGGNAASSAFGNATQTGANMASTLTGIGNAQAAGTLGSANALAGGLTNAGNAGLNGLLLSKLLPGGNANPNPGIYSGGAGEGNTLSTYSNGVVGP